MGRFTNGMQKYSRINIANKRTYLSIKPNVVEVYNAERLGLRNPPRSSYPENGGDGTRVLRFGAENRGFA